jgi:hypothetical protein
MTIATGVAKQVRYKAESAWGTAPGDTGAQLLRRVSSTLSLRKDSFQSNEKVTHYQQVDMRHGMRSVAGAISGELSPGTYEDFLAAAVRKVFVATASITSLSLTIATSGSNYTVTRGSGSWITDGVKVGDVVRISAGSVAAGNLNNNLVVLAETATILTVRPLNRSTLTAEGPIASCTLSVPGKRAWVPLTAHTDPSFAIEHWHSDTEDSELFLGCKLNELSVGLAPGGMGTIGLDFMGKDATFDTADYFTTPTAETETGIVASVNGLLVVQGAVVALLTGLQFSIRGNMTPAGPIVGSNTMADIGEGRITVSGNFSAFFEDGTLRDYFDDETEVSLICVAPVSPANAADFIGFTLPRIKIGSADKDDPDNAITQSLSFTALLNTAGGASAATEETTLVIQDSQA